MYFQQGDCLLFKESELPTLESIPGDLLFKGANHHHRVRGDYALMKAVDATWLISQGCEVYHEEHATLAIPLGAYKLKFVQEYDHFLEESRQVVD